MHTTQEACHTMHASARHCMAKSGGPISSCQDDYYSASWCRGLRCTFHSYYIQYKSMLLGQPLLDLFCLLPISLHWPMICTCTPIQMPITCTSSLPTPPQFKFLLLNSTHLLNCDLQLFIYAHKNMITLSKYCVCHIWTQSHIFN